MNGKNNMEMMKGSVGAIVITFNRLEFLKEIIDALRAQTRKPDEIIVVNNSSTDGTREWLEQQKDLTVIHQDNVGSSGGQYTGFKTAYEKGHDWIWTMDDDVVAAPDVLQKLLTGFDDMTVRTPLRYTSDGKVFFNDTIEFNLTNPFKGFWKRIISEEDLKNEYIEAVGITFEGPLVPRKVVEKIGLPARNFFIYGDDTEYFIRAQKAGAKIIVVRDARYDRKLPYLDMKKEFTWKHYYIIRNDLAINKLHSSLSVRIVRPVVQLARWLGRVKSFADLKVVLKALKDGIFYKLDND